MLLGSKSTGKIYNNTIVNLDIWENNIQANSIDLSSDTDGLHFVFENYTMAEYKDASILIRGIKDSVFIATDSIHIAKIHSLLNTQTNYALNKNNYLFDVVDNIAYTTYKRREKRWLPNLDLVKEISEKFYLALKFADGSTTILKYHERIGENAGKLMGKSIPKGISGSRGSVYVYIQEN